jgi:hypothetical protein
MLNSNFCQQLVQDKITAEIKTPETNISLIEPCVCRLTADDEVEIDSIFKSPNSLKNVLIVQGLENDIILGLDFMTKISVVAEEIQNSAGNLSVELSTHEKALNPLVLVRFRSCD